MRDPQPTLQRGSAVVRLALADATVPQIATFTGHSLIILSPIPTNFPFVPGLNGKKKSGFVGME
jgi:hypothetical protein